MRANVWNCCKDRRSRIRPYVRGKQSESPYYVNKKSREWTMALSNSGASRATRSTNAGARTGSLPVSRENSSTRLYKDQYVEENPPSPYVVTQRENVFSVDLWMLATYTLPARTE